MQPRKFNVVTDAQFGSCAKGHTVSALAKKFLPEFISTTSMANAGHTAVDIDEDKYIAKALPSAAIIPKWLAKTGDKSYLPTVVIGPTAAFHLDQLLKEIELCGLAKDSVMNPGHATLMIHPRAGVITQEQRDRETNLETGTKHVASTMQGCGTFLADKVMRLKGLKLARDYDELRPYTMPECSMPTTLHKAMQHGKTILHEGSQGFSLDINHGCQYPNCTSRGTTAVQNAADMGIGHNMMGDVYLVMRPYPIRVGNVVEDGKVVGYSGDCYDDQKEITWAQVGEEAGMPQDMIDGLLKTELTTVTKRLRRVYTLSWKQLQEAVIVNGATKIALNFANYIDHSCFGCTDYNKLPAKVRQFICDVEDKTGIPVTIVGTGPRIDQVCFL